MPRFVNVDRPIAHRRVHHPVVLRGQGIHARPESATKIPLKNDPHALAAGRERGRPFLTHSTDRGALHQARTNRTTSAPVPAIRRAQAQASMTIATTAATRLVVVLGSVASGLFAELAKRETKMGWPFSLMPPASVVPSCPRAGSW